MEAEQRASHPSGDSKSELRLLTQRFAALEKHPNQTTAGAAQLLLPLPRVVPLLLVQMSPPPLLGRPVEPKQQHSTKSNLATRAANAAFMAADPPDAAAVTSVNVRASAVQAFIPCNMTGLR